ncbi:MAG: hypothetical protein JSU68_11815 [Phycisphaerales bacterium]|nr:MAG: hypothetical protein JSU68_11815 [Phycisphaerales bacterium]
MAVVVATDLYAAIATSLATYADDLASVGFSSTTITFSGNAEFLRNTLISLYNEPESLVGVVLAGPLPHVIYEMNQDWGNGGEYEDFPCDMYLMDMDGTWSDQLDDPPVQPDNGKLDTWTGNRDLEIWVSRMRTDNLTALGTEAEILNTYFARNHTARRSVLNNLYVGLVYDDDDWESMSSVDTYCLRQLFGYTNVVAVDGPEDTTAADFINNRLTADYHLDLIRSHGSPSGHGFYRNNHSTFEYVWREEYALWDPAAAFFSFFVCSGCDYLAGNNLGGTAVFNPEGSGLLAWGSTKTGGMWNDIHMYNQIAAGECVGEAFKYWFNQVNDAPYAPEWWYGMVLIGDGTCHTTTDCNTNDIRDECDIDCQLAGCDVPGCGQSPDCNGNLVPDECDLSDGTSSDCNANEVPDECDLSGGTSEDCNNNGEPDECEPQADCNDNGVQDICDVAGGTSEDCNHNQVPDECDLAAGTSVDGNGNGVLDSCEDCNRNGVQDLREPLAVVFENASAPVGVLGTVAPVAQDIHLPDWARVRQFTVSYASTGSSPGLMVVRFFVGDFVGDIVPVYPEGLIAEYDAGQLPWTGGEAASRTVGVNPPVWVPPDWWMEVEIDRDAGVLLRSDSADVAYTHGRVYDRQAGQVLPGCSYMGLQVMGIQCSPECGCGDVNGSGGQVDLTDFALLANCYGLDASTTECRPSELACSDLNVDGVVDLGDFATFAVLYGLTSTGLPPDCLP